MDYGTGAIMAVPGHDERDHEFATTFGLPIVRVVGRDVHDTALPREVADVETADRVLVNSGRFTGMPVDKAQRAIVAWLGGHGGAKAVVSYRLHDWCISRQRYWGPPIPVIYCDSCGVVPVPERDLPVLLPPLEDINPDDSGISPLARDEKWYRVACPECGKLARRETDVSDTFLDSAWYFLRYPSAKRSDVPFDDALTRQWLPVDSYIGGNEHAVLHLLYSRFITMVLYEAGQLEFEEPFARFRAHGTIVRYGAKMSKSRGNVVNPDEYIERWGADAFRTYLMFLGPFEEGGDFRDQSISGVRRFLDRLWASVHEARRDGEPDSAVMRKVHQTIRKVTDDIPALGYNTAIAMMMECVNVIRAHERVPHLREVEPLVQLVAPFAPHIAEELWETIGHAGSIFDSSWPESDAAMAAESSATVAVQVNGRMRGTVRTAVDAGQEAVVAAAMADESIWKFVTGTPKKVIFVRNRLLNVVV
jgi:leucyl-tRNA synthetase